MLEDLTNVAEAVGARLKSRGETVAVAESSSGGLISAALLAVPGASAYFIGGGVISQSTSGGRPIQSHPTASLSKYSLDHSWSSQATPRT